MKKRTYGAEFRAMLSFTRTGRQNPTYGSVLVIIGIRPYVTADAF